MKKFKFLLALLVLATALRLGGVNLPYHQDEWKTAHGVELGAKGTTGLYHPPLTQLLYQADGKIFGVNHLRYLPLIFGLLSAALIYLVLKKIADPETGLIGLFLYTTSALAVWGSLQLDTDGAILPTFFLLALYCYLEATSGAGRRFGWWSLTALVLLLGLLVKLSFILVVGVLACDFIIQSWRAGHRREVAYGALGLGGLGLAFVGGVALVHWLYPAFSIAGMISHAQSFAHLGGRSYGQVLIQTLKFVMFLSPLLLVAVCPPAPSWRQTRLFWLYLALGFIFYFVIFDFSHGALDKYLIYAVVPVVSIAALYITPLIRQTSQDKLVRAFGIGLVLSLALMALNFLPQQVIPLYPKTSWFSAVAHGHWSILTPFTGGSGPLGFYVSFLFIAVSFGLGLVMAAVAWLRPQWRSQAMVVLIVISLTHNAVFIEELLAGRLNGSAPQVLKLAIGYLATTPTSQKVITHNDIGAFELNSLSKYEGRFYAAPQYESVHRELFAGFHGNYLVVDLPRFNPDSFYGKFFSNCRAPFKATSGHVTATVYSC
jgi:hypothetical protein